MIKIECIICGEEIVKPKVGQLCCGNDSCREEFDRNQIELWKMENPDKVKDMNRKAYDQRKYNDAQPKTL